MNDADRKFFDGEGKMNIEEYLRRNLVVSKAYGVRAGLDTALVRLSKMKKRPKWLFDLLGKEYARMDDIIRATILFRGDLKEHKP